MLVTEPTPMVFDENYSVLGKSKKKFMPGRFSPVWLVLSFCFVLFALNVIMFVYNGST